MDYLGAVFIVVAFVYLIKQTRLIENSVRVISIAKEAVADISNPDLPDEIKEVAVQKHALHLIRLFILLTVCAVISVGLPVGLVWLLDALNLISFNEVIAITLSAWFLLLSTIIVLVFFRLTRINRK